MATTTSTRDSGLLDVLLQQFESEHRCRVDVVAVGTGAALRLGERGDVDALLVHARDAEEVFMNAGHGTRHEEFMCNEFLLIGPADDPAGIRDLDPIEALKRIAQQQQQFISRGDNSGTHIRELRLWRQTEGRPEWEHYLESGQGMGPTLLMADEKQAYTMTDTGTYLRFQDKIELAALAKRAPSMRNPYAAIAVNPVKHAAINQSLANALIDFLISAECQQAIAAFQVDGQPLFHPTRLGGEE